MWNVTQKSRAIDWIVDCLTDNTLFSLDNCLLRANALHTLDSDNLILVSKLINKYYSEPESTIRELLKIQGKLALEEENPYFAHLAFKKLNDTNGLNKTFELAIRLNWMYDAGCIVEITKNRYHLKKLIEAKQKSKQLIWNDIDDCIYKYLGNEFSNNFKKYCRNRRVKPRAEFSPTNTINAAYALSPKYDVGVGIARGGLTSSYVFNLIGLPVILCEAHRKGNGATFEWKHSPEKLKGKRILVLDKDSVSGRTLRRTVREILPYSPSDLGVYFNHNPPLVHLDKVPKEFSNVYYPANMEYNQFYEAIIKFQKELSKRK